MVYLDTKDLPLYKVKAKDDDLGTLKDVIFDDEYFFVRYFVLDTGSLLSKNEVLVSPISLKGIDTKKRELHLLLGRKELENAPKVYDIETIDKEYESKYNQYFNLSNYWEAIKSPWITGPYGIPWSIHNSTRSLSSKPKGLEVELSTNNRLRSENELLKYRVQGSDKEFGHIQSILIDTSTFSITFFVIDTVNYLPSRLVLLRTEWIENISWKEQNIKFPFSKEKILGAPRYENCSLTKEEIKDIDEHFGFQRKFINQHSENNRNSFTIYKYRSKISLSSSKTGS